MVRLSRFSCNDSGRRIESKSSIQSRFETVCEVTNLLSMTLTDSYPQAKLRPALSDSVNNNKLKCVSSVIRLVNF